MNASPSVPEPQALFPTLGSLQEVLDLAESRLPIMDRNTLVTLLGTHHNTLLSLWAQTRKH